MDPLFRGCYPGDVWAHLGSDAPRIEPEDLRTIATPEEGLAVDEPRIQDYGDAGNIHKKVGFAFGDVQAGFAEADHVFDDTFFYQGNTHLAMEEHAAVAQSELHGSGAEAGGHLTLWTSTQTPHYVHRALAISELAYVLVTGRIAFFGRAAASP